MRDPIRCGAELAPDARAERVRCARAEHGEPDAVGPEVFRPDARRALAHVRGRLPVTYAGDDPHVERLLEGVAFLAARVHLKIDDEFPEVTEALLSILYWKSDAATDLIYTVEASPDLSPNSWTPASGSSAVLSDDGTVSRIRFTAPAGGSTRKFLRVKVAY